MPSIIRRQLTLFVDPKDAKIIEQVRKEFNPKQFEIIQAHVTLCREEEIQDLEKVISNLIVCSRTQPIIFIEFGKVERFDNGKGLFLPATNNNREYAALRKYILSGIIDHPKNHEPHITLMHPRNATCNETIYKQVQNKNLPSKLAFSQISLIEQVNGGPWKTLAIFPFKN
jgi:2'-5' RNA ligase